MYDSLAHLAALAHEAEVRRVAASPAQQVRHELPRARRRPRWRLRPAV
jgi:hypothetical protein